ncbi:stage 0 sporulation protein [Patescibacteria group bacterium]|nr:stage 0 sporulation protein [Patescibacteria group bacterium]
MIIFFVQLAPWDNPYQFTQMRGGRLIDRDHFKVGDQVIIKTDLGTDLGKIIKIEEKTEQEDQKGENFILRKASSDDIKRWKEKNKNKAEVIKKCEFLVRKKKLPMKIIDALFGFDGSKITFAFTAPSRIDFRNLVKDLVQKFHKSIRMHQVGARQETGLAGDIGPCGRSLCCLSFLKKLGHITTEMMFDQQLSQRGPERLSGICGRLKCCLAFENEMYKELKEKLPALGTKVKTKKGTGKVIDWHILKQSVVIEIKEGKEKTRIEVPINEIK